MAEKPALYVLDTFALIAHFEAEIGGEKVRDLLKQAEDGEVFLAMSLINIGELAYIIKRQQGEARTRDVLADYAISYSDAFAAFLAQELGASLVTGDPEFRKIKQNLSLVWLDK